MSQGFLGTLWPIFAIARILGLFPCKRLKTEDGKIVLAPISHKIQLLLFTIFYGGLFTTIHVISFYYGFTYNKSFTENFTCFLHLYLGTESIVDGIVFGILFLFIHISTFLICYGTYKMKTGLCEISHQIKHSNKTKSAKSMKSFYIILILFMIWSICMAMNIGLDMIA